MPITIEEVKDKIDVLFQGREELDAAFASMAFADELGCALSYVNGGGSLDWEYFNRILIAANLGPVDRRLFERYVFFYRPGGHDRPRQFGHRRWRVG